MILKNCRYMKSAEFKERQGWLAFTDAVGIVLEVMSKTLENLALFKPFSFCKGFQSAQPIKTPAQLTLKFIRNISEWADWRLEKNLQIFI